MRGVAATTAASVVDVDRGLLHTFVGMTVRPGVVIRDYLAGRTVAYTGPARYFVIMVTLVVLVYVQMGTASHLVPGGAPEGTAGQLLNFLQAHLNLLIALNVPFGALATRVVYRRFGMNYAEHLVFNLYTNAHQSLLLIPLSVGGALFGNVGLMMSAYSIAGVGYLVWAARSLFGIGIVAAVLRTLLSQALMMLTAALIGMAASLAYLVLTH